MIHDEYALIRPDMRVSVIEYVCFGIPNGDFVRAVLANDLSEACGRADHENRYALWSWGMLRSNRLPQECTGSHDAVAAWCEARQENPLPVDAVNWPESWAREVDLVRADAARRSPEGRA